MDINSNGIESIVKQVIADPRAPEKGQTPGPSVFTLSPLNRQSGVMVYGSKTGNDSVFDDIEDAIEAAYQAQRDYMTNYKTYDGQRIVEAIRRTIRNYVKAMCRMIVEKTKTGHYEGKLEKHLVVISKTSGPDCPNTETISGNEDLILGEYALFGVIAVITPATNPTGAITNNTISMITGGDTVVFNVHPTIEQVSACRLQLLNRAIVDVGGPESLITMAKEPTMENVNKLAANPHTRMIVGTGGMDMINALLHSGKRTTGAGVDNPPVVMDEAADVELAGGETYKGALFDNNILYFVEKRAFVVGGAADDFLCSLRKQGVYLLDSIQTERLLSTIFQSKKQGNGHEVNKQWVDCDASRILEQIGVTGTDIGLLIYKVEKDHSLVTVEQMMLIPPIVRCRGFERAVEWAVEAERGNRYIASVLSEDMEHMTRSTRVVEATIYVKDRVTMVGVGIRREGHCTMAIAGSTGEGITNTKSFTRRRRCMLAEGGSRIIQIETVQGGNENDNSRIY